MDIVRIFDKPKIIGIVGDVNTGKSNFIYWIISELRKNNKFNLYTFGLRKNIPYSKTIYSVEELEQIKDSVIILDEVMTLWDLDNRKIKKQVENTLRLINHNNNILILSFVPENIKKFISGKVDEWFFKKVTLCDFINGSSVKNALLHYRGYERGNTILNLNVDEAIYFNNHYSKISIPYLKDYDTKLKNKPIFNLKSGGKK